MSLVKNRDNYFSWINGLKAFSLIIVVIYNFNNSYLPLGYQGIDISFVIVGFLITNSLWGKKCVNFTEFLSNFYIKKIFKIIPAIFLYVFITSLAILLFNPEPRYELSTGFASLLGISNIYLTKNSFNYFADVAILNPFVNTWSLGVILQFYLIFPIFFYFTIALKGKRARNLLIFLISLTIVVSIFLFVFLYSYFFRFL